MENSFLDYAMSVIMSRALPDVRDGLKPVHRRIIWDMERAGLPARPHLRQVRPRHRRHDGALPPARRTRPIYDALVRMAQPFSLRHPLIDFHGNYGSPDFGPPPSATPSAGWPRWRCELLADIDEDTVDMMPNYDGSTEQPTVLPARFPNLLVNGSQGIAVGMATNIPPHNLGEVIDATIHLIDNPEATPDDLMHFVKGPDFPTGASILGRAGIMDAYRTGRGSVKMRATAMIEENKKGRDRRSSSPSCRTRRAARRSPGASRSWSTPATSTASPTSTTTRPAARPSLVITLKRDANANVVLNKLYKLTQLQTIFVDQHGRPRRRRAAHAQPRPGAARLRRPPGRGRSPGAPSSASSGPRIAPTSSRAASRRST